MGQSVVRYFLQSLETYMPLDQIQRHPWDRLCGARFQRGHRHLILHAVVHVGSYCRPVQASPVLAEAEFGDDYHTIRV
jgi:hypothetical protein